MGPTFIDRGNQILGKDSFGGAVINDLQITRPKFALFNLTTNPDSALLKASSLVRCRANDRPVAVKGFLAHY